MRSAATAAMVDAVRNFTFSFINALFKSKRQLPIENLYTFSCQLTTFLLRLQVANRTCCQLTTHKL